MKNTMQNIAPFNALRIGMLAAFIRLCREIYSSWDLVVQLFRREVFAQFKMSFIGSFWLVVSPVAAIISWVFLYRAHILHAGDVGVPYPAYVLVGSAFWGFFMSMYRTSASLLQTSRYLILNVSVPRGAVFFGPLLSRFTDFIITIIITLAVLFLFGIAPSWKIIFLPLLVLPLFFLATAVGLLISLISAVSYDFKRMVSWLLGLTMFATPVVYSLEAIGGGWMRAVVLVNPLTYLVCSARDMILFGSLFMPNRYVVSCICSFCFFVFAWRIFYVTEKRIIERML